MCVVFKKVATTEFNTSHHSEVRWQKKKKALLLLPGGHVLAVGTLHVDVEGLHPGVTTRTVGALVELSLQVVHRLVAPQLGRTAVALVAHAAPVEAGSPGVDRRRRWPTALAGGGCPLRLPAMRRMRWR